MSASAAPVQPPPTKEEAEMTQSLAQDRPTIDAAIKSYISLVCAKALTASATDNVTSSIPSNTTTTTTAVVPATTATNKEEEPKTLLGLIPSAGLAATTNGSNSNNSNNQQQASSASVQQHVLQLARIMLQTLNQYTFPIHCTVLANSMIMDKPGLAASQKHDLLELSITAQLWNGLVQSKQKPSRFLGKRALKHAWKNQLGSELRTKLSLSSQTPDVVVLQQQLQWLDEFERLLFVNTLSVSETNVDDDSALLWAPDGGAKELAKRQERRRQAATQRNNTT